MHCCASLLAAVLFGACSSSSPSRQRQDRQSPSSPRARRTCSGRAFMRAPRRRRRSSASTSSGEARFAKTTARRRSPRSKASSRAASRASCWRPSTKRRWSGPVGDAARAKIPVVIIDSGLKGSDYISFVATDNRQGGRMAAEGLAKMLPQGGKVVMLRYAEGSASTEDREAGLSRGDRQAHEHPGAQLESVRRRRCRRRVQDEPRRCSTASADLTDRSSSTASSRRTSRPRSRCCACCSTSGWAGKVKFIGFDASDTLVKGLSDGHIDGARRSGSGQHGLSRREDDGRSPSGPSGREANRYRRAAHHPRQNVTTPPSRSCCSRILVCDG